MLRAGVVSSSSHTLQNIYDLIIDVDAYGSFLPYCHQSKVISFEDDVMIADLVIGVGLYKKRYRSKVICSPPSKGKASITITMIEGPLKSLDATWVLSDLKPHQPQNREIKFSISLEFKMGIFNSLLSSKIKPLCDTILRAFERRADELYASHENT